jgi:hypothetical protein
VGKRSEFERIPKDKYMTFDRNPVRILQPHLPPGLLYAEPCAGNGDLIESMKWHGHECVYACDIKPGRKWIEKRDARELNGRWRRGTQAQMFVTNLPWSRDIMHELIDHLSSLLPLWCLGAADWAHTRQAARYLDRCQHIVSAGRVRWIPNTTDVGVDNTSWYLFDRRHTGGPRFTGLVDGKAVTTSVV